MSWRVLLVAHAQQGNLPGPAATQAVNAEAARAQSAESALSARISAIENGIDLGVF